MSFFTCFYDSSSPIATIKKFIALVLQPSFVKL